MLADEQENRGNGMKDEPNVELIVSGVAVFLVLFRLQFQ